HLPLDVGCAHEDGAGEVELGADRRRRHAMLAGTGLGDDAGFAHALGEENLAKAIVDLVRTGVVQLFALEPDLGAAEVLAEALSVIKGARAAGIVDRKILE